MSQSQIDIKTIREKLGMLQGERYWRSLEELAETPRFQEMLHREFPKEASVWDDALNRRGFIKMMGASLALAGVSGCVKQPAEKIIPYVKQPENLVPGKHLYFATAVPCSGGAVGVLAKSYMGRPVHLEGNPLHPASQGSLDAIPQSEILSLYDPDRSQVVLHNGSISTWSKFYDELHRHLEVQTALRGSGLRILSGIVISPTLAAQRRAFLDRYPEAVWHSYEPVNDDNLLEGSMLAFGEPMLPIYHFDKADVVLLLDDDALAQGRGHIKYARDYAARRRVRGSSASMNRLYVAESTPTVTGSVADHRLRVRASEVESLARALAFRLGITGASSVSLDEHRDRWVAITASDLKRNPGRTIISAGPNQPAVVHGLVHAINKSLGNHGSTISFVEPIESQPVNNTESLSQLASAMDSGKVDALIVLGGNPAYNAPFDLEFTDRLKNVKFTARLGLYADETSAACEWHIPESHFLEGWSDTRAFDGTATIIQPLIAPLYNGKPTHEVVDDILCRPDRKSHDIVRDHWRSQVKNPDFERFWKRSLHDGVVEGSAFALKQVSALTDVSKLPPAMGRSSSIELMFQPDPSIGDGVHANNGWLQELPKPLTKLTWDNAAYVSPATAERLGLINEDVVDLVFKGKTAQAPVWISMGHPDDSVTLHLGYGREKSGRVGTGIGVNAYALRHSTQPWFDNGLEIRKTGSRYRLASTQDHHSMEGRPIVRTSDVSGFFANPDFAKEMGHTPKPEESLYPRFEYDGNAWGMVIDLNACTGCNACTIACQSENNIPVVGKEQVEIGREMHWIRIDRYYEGSIDDPKVLTQPLGCVHCENAPCEVVCPVAATTHDSEGLNVMTYNRCVGTRYCANNCPYKVRRFNFLQYSDTETEVLSMMNNPDVTVRNRGVMEKCTYCVQRISATRIEAKKEGREIRDGEIVTACQSACPSQAIAFGNINDTQSEVSKLRADPRAYGLLAELNTNPRTLYLAKLSNPNPEFGSAS